MAILSDSQKQLVKFPKLNKGRTVEINIDCSTNLKPLLKSKKSKIGVEFKKEMMFFSITPTILGLLLNKGNKSLEQRIIDDCESSQKTLVDTALKNLEEGEQISEAFFLLVLEEDYQIGQRYRVEISLLYR